MGQAFDEHGNVLGEAVGHDKREVFEKLMAEHEDAAELRIRSRFAAPPAATEANPSTVSAEMPRYLCHKTVHALKLGGVGPKEPDGSAWLYPTDAGYAPFRVAAEYMTKHAPHVGGYFVVYDDGYSSFSPAKAFEEGYTPI